MTPATPRFRFACQRSGRCCTHGEGRVWLEEGELERLAQALELDAAAFAERYVRRVVDPARGEPRLSLLEHAGRCALLEGTHHCTVYADRPEQCRTFPFWSSVLAGGAAFEAARSVCPGIAVEVEPESRTEAARAFDERFGAWPPERRACPFEERGVGVFISGLEADRLIDSAGTAPNAGPACPYEEGGACRAGAARPLACRLAGRADEEQGRALEALRALEEQLGYPRAYGSIAQLVRARSGPSSSEAAT